MLNKKFKLLVTIFEKNMPLKNEKSTISEELNKLKDQKAELEKDVEILKKEKPKICGEFCDEQIVYYHYSILFLVIIIVYLGSRIYRQTSI